MSSHLFAPQNEFLFQTDNKACSGTVSLNESTNKWKAVIIAQSEPLIQFEAEADTKTEAQWLAVGKWLAPDQALTTYTKQAPTVPGWYWVRDPQQPDYQDAIYYLSAGDPPQEFEYESCLSFEIISKQEYEVAGPIPKPEE